MQYIRYIKTRDETEDVMHKTHHNANQATYISWLLAEHTIVYENLQYREKNEQIYYTQDKMET